MGVPDEVPLVAHPPFPDWTHSTTAQLSDYCRADIDEHSCPANGCTYDTYEDIRSDSNALTLSSIASMATNGGMLQNSNKPNAYGVECEDYLPPLPNLQHNSYHSATHRPGHTPRKDIEAKARKKNRASHHALRNLLTRIEPKLSFRGQADVMRAATEMICHQQAKIIGLEKLLNQTRQT